MLSLHQHFAWTTQPPQTTTAITSNHSHHHNSNSNMARTRTHSMLNDIVEIVVPSAAFLDEPAVLSGNNSGDADTVTLDTYSHEAQKLMEATVGPKVISERFTNEAIRDLDPAYLRQFENAFDLFLMQNPALIPGNADTIDALRSHLMKTSAEKARAELELRMQLDALVRSKEQMERELMEELRAASRTKAERRVELTRQLERIQSSRLDIEMSMRRKIAIAEEEVDALKGRLERGVASAADRDAASVSSSVSASASGVAASAAGSRSVISSATASAAHREPCHGRRPFDSRSISSSGSSSASCRPTLTYLRSAVVRPQTANREKFDSFIGGSGERALVREPASNGCEDSDIGTITTRTGVKKSPSNEFKSSQQQQYTMKALQATRIVSTTKYGGGNEAIKASE